MSGAEATSIVITAIAFLYLAVVSVILSVIDISTHRLPNRIVLPSWLVGLLLLIVASMLAADSGRLGRAALAMILLFAGYFVMRLISPTSIGGGDVKLAGLLGLYLGWVSWSAVLIGAAAAFLIGGAYALILLASRRADRRTRIPFGPAMIGGAWVAIITASLPNMLAAL